jgi:hypothetical protein
MQPTEYAQQIGPSIFYGGIGIPAMVAGANKDNINPGAVPAIYMQTPIQTIYAAPVPGGVTLATGAAAASGVALTNTSTFAPGVAPGTAAQLAGTPVFNAVALDIALDKAAAVTSGNVITLAKPANIWRYTKGMWLAIGGAGLAGATLFAQVLALGTPANGQITISAVPSTAQANAEVGITNRYSLYGYGNPAPSGVSDFVAGGMGRFLIPECATARGVGVTGVAGGTGGPVLIQGLDIYNQPQSEIITATAGATTAYGKKTYSTIIAATPQFNDAHAYTVVTSDLMGFPISVVPSAPPPTIMLGATAQTGTLVGIQYADQTAPATTTTGDPRGAFQMSTKGPNAGVTGTGPDGTSIVSVTQTISALAAVTGSMLNPGPLFGVPTV